MRRLLATAVSLGVLASAGVAAASTIALAPATVAVTKGQTIAVTINVDPAGTKIYTVKGVVNYPADILEATSFTFAPGTPMWIPLSQPGYDSMTAGNVTKTAGFPGGFTTTKALGTITFRAKESGTATISVSPQSVAYDAQSKNTVSGVQGSSVVTITAPVPVEPKPTTPKPTTPSPTTAAQTITGQVATTAEATTSEAAVVAATESQAAAAGILSNNGLLALIALLVAALAGGAWWYFLRRKPTL